MKNNEGKRMLKQWWKDFTSSVKAVGREMDIALGDPIAMHNTHAAQPNRDIDPPLCADGKTLDDLIIGDDPNEPRL